MEVTKVEEEVTDTEIRIKEIQEILTTVILTIQVQGIKLLEALMEVTEDVRFLFPLLYTTRFMSSPFAFFSRFSRFRSSSS